MSHARTRLRALVVAVLAVAISGGTMTAAHAAPSKDEINKKIDKASDDLEDVTEAYNKLRISLKKTASDEKKLAASIAPAKKAHDAAAAQLGVIAASAYKGGQVGTVNVILEGPGSLLERMSVVEQMSRTRQREINAYLETTKTYRERQTALEATRAKQNAEAKELDKRKKKIQADLKKLYKMRTAAYGSPTEKGSRYTGDIPSIPGSAGKAVSFAYNQIGKMYGFGDAGPNTYDCSGLTMAAWNKGGKSLPHQASAQYSATIRISRSDLQPGDLVFYRSLKHVGLYVGGGQIIDASRAGQPVKKRDMDIMTPHSYGRVR